MTGHQPEEMIAASSPRNPRATTPSPPTTNCPLSKLPRGNKIATHLAKPYLQVNTAELAGWLDDYIWTQLFDAAFNPLDDENWRLLLLQPVVDNITKVFAVALLESEQKHVTGQTEVLLRHLSEVPRLMMRESHSVEVSKCIYTRLTSAQRRAGARLHPLGAGRHADAGVLQDQRKSSYLCPPALRGG